MYNGFPELQDALSTEFEQDIIIYDDRKSKIDKLDDGQVNDLVEFVLSL